MIPNPSAAHGGNVVPSRTFSLQVVRSHNTIVTHGPFHGHCTKGPGIASELDASLGLGPSVSTRTGLGPDTIPPMA